MFCQALGSEYPRRSVRHNSIEVASTCFSTAGSAWASVLTYPFEITYAEAGSAIVSDTPCKRASTMPRTRAGWLAMVFSLVISPLDASWT